ncbi:peptidoglycan DD-metalloendopeptidase family protein [Neobacillus sp. MM2021_6]|uniref:murein hydrolase activator EnvC family protein n=1 Tax=Bacillaceae TaxID=186817 RepID=UPI001409E3CE|nr:MULTISPECIES: M23 family metallopeptidase [Bacillaceae]MBO0959070.1 peptidoglycan DD-metalloendopeptidase family protein [Neobacillus sp. MM2021_6]NHC21398.1 peptidoglycan DD-metalloendopeptidase family protein [Bacillus sp. MM2020_4]
MRKKVMMLTIAASIGMGTAFGGLSIKTEAASISKLKGDQSKIQEKRSDVKSGLNEANEKINSIKGQQEDVKNDMKRIDFAIGDTTTKMNEKSAKIEETKAEIVKLQEETKIIMERIEKRNVLLKDRARSYQETGGMVSYIDVLMGSTSFSDFIDRANAVATIMQADQDILKQHEADKKQLELNQEQVKNDLAGLEKMLADLEAMKQHLAVQKAEKDKLLTNLNEQEQEAHEYVMDMQEQEQILAAQENAIQMSIKLEQERQAKAAAAAAAAAAKAQGNASSGGGGAVATTPPVSGGSFTRPTSGVITSGFGGRDGAFHYGVDIAKAGTVPIVAAADGVVYVSHYSNSYGNVIYILHNINGKTYTTVYAHMQTRLVGEGTTVSKGQQIGIMGNTGDSHGQHLHFELYQGRWAYHSAISPMGIVPL